MSHRATCRTSKLHYKRLKPLKLTWQEEDADPSCILFFFFFLVMTHMKPTVIPEKEANLTICTVVTVQPVTQSPDG